jgi:6-phosphogluconolactonase
MSREDRDDLDTSRRDFLAASAFGLLGMTIGARAPRGAQRADVEPLYVGTYTEDGRVDGIHRVDFDTRTGALRLVGSFNGGPNPSFLAIHPNRRVLYAVNETTERDGKPSGVVSAFTIAADGKLALLNEQASEGGAPCYVSVDRDGRVLLVANYVGGNVALLPIRENGSLGSAAHIVQHRGPTGPNTSRQEGSHAHCIRPDASNRWVLAADLGIDAVLLYRLDAAAGTLERVAGGETFVRAGAGPRHLAFHPTLPLVFVANELDSTVTTLRFDATAGRLTTVSTISTLPAGWTGTSYVADIHVSPSGRHVYVSNRGHNSIAVFMVATSAGGLVLEQTISTEGDWPRNFALDPTGRWLLAANQRSGSIVVFNRDPNTGRLTRSGQTLSVPSPVCLLFTGAAG